jgi:hypothetical protein
MAAKVRVSQSMEVEITYSKRMASESFEDGIYYVYGNGRVIGLVARERYSGHRHAWRYMTPEAQGWRVAQSRKAAAEQLAHLAYNGNHVMRQFLKIGSK